MNRPRRFVIGSHEQATGPYPHMTCSGYGHIPHMFTHGPCEGPPTQAYPPQVVGQMPTERKSDGTVIVIIDDLYAAIGGKPQTYGIYSGADGGYVGM